MTRWGQAGHKNAFQYCPRVSLPSDPSQIYLGGEPVEDERRAAKHRLVREVKRVVDNAALLDVGANDVDGLTAAAEAIGTRAGWTGCRPRRTRRRAGWAAE